MVHGEQVLSYSRLDAESDALAGILSEMGVKTEDRVGVLIERSVDLFAAVLGILKVGAAYVAVDSRLPEERRGLMLTRSEAKLILVDRENAASVRNLDATLLHSDGSWIEAAHRASDGWVEPSPNTAACMLFTSGSSGEPKAVVLEHRNIASFAVNSSLPKLNYEDRVGQVSSVSFDAFHYEIWATLSHGACSVILPSIPDLLAADFQRQMKRHRITSMLVPTMVANHVVREDRNAFSSLRILQVGGDVVLPSTCRDVLNSEFKGEFVNLYGPSEISTACTVHRINLDDTEKSSIPIGVPVDGATIHILSSDLMPVPDGEIGELFVGGEGVARGYHGQAGLTAERFVQLGYLDKSGKQRYYRTGDLAVRHSDGVLEFRGRADRQVKIRGYRVEPDEIERVLRRPNGIYDSAVLIDGNVNDRRIIAFVAMESDAEISILELRTWAERELPDYMVPSRFVLVPSLPANVHGKRDLVVLEQLAEDERKRAVGYVSPITQTEQYLAALWEELLGIENIGRNEDFFGLGGHSMQVFRVHSRIGRDLGVTMEFPDVLETPVLQDLALAIDEQAQVGGTQ